ncbi:MAG TPA: hypothetical protein PLL77_02405 [Pyrinomonadaceae bacterium]|nr:hypothetical protein [Pyrinomonadaceae bacterium]
MALEREFERCRGGPTEAAQKRVHITISPQKLILLNRNAYHMLGKPEAVHLNYSRTRDIIAIEPASPRLPDAFPVVANRCNWRINTAPFCRHFGIDIDTTLKFIRPEIEGNALYLKLSETVSVGGRKRRKR